MSQVLRSFLFAPGDRPDRMAKALGSGPDALILDLEDAVAMAEKDVARRAVARFLATASRGPAIFVRINALDEDMLDADLNAILPGRPMGILLPKCEGTKPLIRLNEALVMRGDRTTVVLPIAAETPGALFRLGEFTGGSGRLIGLTWGAEDLHVALGGAANRGEDGRLTAPFALARNLVLYAAAAGVAAIETVYPAVRDLDGLRACAAEAAQDGFSGMMAIHPDQVPIINAAFTPTDHAIAHARAVVAAFAENPGAGVLTLDGRMINAPHHKRAQKLLARLPQAVRSP